MSARKRRVSSLPKFQVIAGSCLGHRVYRGFAPLRDLAAISQADLFDQENNPLGTQRNLSSAHARKAYKYVSEIEKAFYPEIILNIRDSSFVEFRVQNNNESMFGILQFVKDPRITNQIIVSRLDGNHRLWFVDGHERGMDAVLRPTSFCFLQLPKLNDELELFRDINDNQMGMNTSHLQNITARLLGEKALKVTNPALYIVQKLQKDSTSPLYQRIHEGGRIKKGATLSGLTVANLTDAVRGMMSRSAKLSQFPDADAQFTVIKHYWNALKAWLPEAWKRPGDYAIFRGVGLYAVAYIGAEIIDRCLLRNKFECGDMLEYLRKITQKETLTVKGKVGYVGRAGGRRLANDLIADLEEEGEISTSKLQKMILGSN